MRRAILALVVAAGGCFDPNYPTDLACSASHTCPPGQSCGSDGICHLAGNGTGTPDAAIDSAPACNPSVDAGACDPFCNSGCASGQRCDIDETFTNDTVCVAPGTGQSGEACTSGSSSDSCATGLSCLSGFDKRCHSFCQTDTDCPGSCCNISGSSQGDVFVCGLATGCDPTQPVSSGCASIANQLGQYVGCYFVPCGGQPAHTECSPVLNFQQTGSTCQFNNYCLPGNRCQRNLSQIFTCHKVCALGGSDCPTGYTCVAENLGMGHMSTSYGECQPVANCGDGVCTEADSCSSCAAECGNCAGGCMNPIPLTLTHTGAAYQVAAFGNTTGAMNLDAPPMMTGSDCDPTMSNAPDRTYRFTAPITGKCTAATDQGTGFDTTLTVRQGTCTGTVLGCNDEEFKFPTGGTPVGFSAVHFSVTASTQYFVTVDGFGTDSGAFKLTITCEPALTTDGSCSAAETCSTSPTECGACSASCANAKSITGNPVSIEGTTTGASNTDTPDATCSAGSTAPDRWFTYTPTANGPCHATTVDPLTDFDTVLTVKSGCTTNVACNDDATGIFGPSTVTWTATANQPVFIVVDGYQANSGHFKLTVSCP